MPFLAPLVGVAVTAEGATAAGIGVGMGIAGAGVSAFSSIMSGAQATASAKTQAQLQARNLQYQGEAAQSEAQATEYNKEVVLQRAEAAQRQGDVEAQKLRLQQKRAAGTAAAGVGASGVTTAGSPLDVMNENTRLMEQDLLTQGYNTAVNVNQFTSQAKLLDYQAEQQRLTGGYYSSTAPLVASSAPNYTAAGVMQAGSTLLGSGYKFFGPQSYLNSKPSFDVGY